MELNDIPGHVSYILIAISYWLTNIFWLRVTAVLGLSMEILYFQLSGGDLSTGIAWDVVFIAINAYQLYWLYDEHRKAAKLEGSEYLMSGAFAGLSKLHLSRLAQLGEWRDLPAGTALTHENAPVAELFYLATGGCAVHKDGEPVAVVHQGAFVGEMAFLSGAPGTVRDFVAWGQRFDIQAAARVNRSPKRMAN
jgi:hypothetical protein